MKHWKQHIGIVGTEAKINQEELVKSRRKIWSLPMALVTALLLGRTAWSAVLAQTNAKPNIASLDDVEVRLAGDAATVELTKSITDATKVTIANVDHDGDGGTTPAISVQVPEQLAVTVMTDNTGRTDISLPEGDGTYNDDDDFAPETNTVSYDHDGAGPILAIQITTVPSAVAMWWDGLTDAERRAAVGARLMDDTLADDNEAQGPCDSTDWCFDFDHDGDDGDADETATVRRFKNYTTVPAVAGTRGEIEDLENPQRVIVTKAFHWDMLSAAEMVVVAEAANLNDFITTNDDDNYNAFKARFGGLTEEQRGEVQSLYTDGYLVRGVLADLTVAPGDPAIEGNADNDFQDMRIGEAEITVKVSDSYGRLIPPGSGSDTVGDSFTVDVQGTKLQQLRNAGVEPGPEDIRLIEETEGEADAAVVTKRTLRISGEAETVATISVQAANIEGGTAQDIEGTFDTTRGRLRDGGELGLSVNPDGTRADRGDAADAPLTIDTDDMDTFTIELEDYSKLRDGGTFTFRAYALTEEVNWIEIEFTIELAVGNQPPVFSGSPDDTMTISEALAIGEELIDYDASDPDHTTGVTFSVTGDTQDVNGNTIFQIGSIDGKLKVGPMALNYQGDQTEGCAEDDAEADDAEADDAEADDEETDEAL